MRQRLRPKKNWLRDIKATMLAIVLMAGGATAVRAAESDGSFDTTWAGSGISYGSNIANGRSSIDTKILSNDKYIVLSSLQTSGANSPTGFVLNQYTAAGVPDTSFSTDGQVERSMSGGMAYMEPAHMQILSDGSILVIGHFGFSGGAFIAKYDSSGAVVSSFGTNGLATASTTSNDSAMYYSSFVAPSGNIYVMSKMNLVTLTRFTSAGALDTTGFGSSGSQGFFTSSSGGLGNSTYYWRGFSVNEASSPAKITFWGADNNNGNVIATRWNMAATSGRIEPTTVDTAYATNGFFSLPTGLTGGVPQVRFMSQAPSGNVYMRYEGKLIGFNPAAAAAVANFGTNGVVDLGSLGISTYFSLSATTVSSSDFVFITGFATASVVAKFDGTGALASGFGTGGVKSVSPCGALTVNNALRRSDGSILISGHLFDFQASSFSLRQFLLGNGGSTTQCGTTTTTTTSPPISGGGGGGGGGSMPQSPTMLSVPVATAIEVPGEGIRVTVSNLAANAKIAAMTQESGVTFGPQSTEMPWVTEGTTNSQTLMVTQLSFVPASAPSPTVSRTAPLKAGVTYRVRVYQIEGTFFNPTKMSSSLLITLTLSKDVAATTTTAPTTTAPAATTTTTTTVPKDVYATAVPGVTVTDTKVYTTAPAKVAATSAIDVLTPAQAKTSDIVSQTPSVCLPNDEDLVFIDQGRCIAQVVNEKTRKVLRTLRTTVVADDISEIKVGNEIAVLSPLYFTAGTATMKAVSVRRLNSLTAQVKAAGSILVAGHSGVLMGDTPENRALSRQRAATVVSALKKRGATADFAIAAVGALDPVSTGDSRADQDKNRRAVIVLIP